jgi:hypothetical protein
MPSLEDENPEVDSSEEIPDPSGDS